MLEILACVKGLACLLQQADTWMSSYLFQAVYLQMQSFVQLALTHTEPRDKVMPSPQEAIASSRKTFQKAEPPKT